MRYIKRVLAIAACLCLILSFSVLPASASYDALQTEYNFTLEGYPYHDTTNDSSHWFSNGIFIQEDFDAVYYEFIARSASARRIGSSMKPTIGFVEFDGIGLTGVTSSNYLFTPLFYNDSSFSIAYDIYLYDTSGNLIAEYSKSNTVDSDLPFPCFVMPWGSIDRSKELASNGMNLPLTNYLYTTFSAGDTTYTSFYDSYSYRASLNIPAFTPVVTINGVSYNGTTDNPSVLVGSGVLEPVTDANGNITNYIINNEIDISPLTESDEDPRNPHSLNSSELDELEAGLLSEDVTIPEFDSSLVEGSGTYWNMVEQLLDTSGLKPVVLFALAVGLASFIIGRKT